MLGSSQHSAHTGTQGFEYFLPQSPQILIHARHCHSYGLPQIESRLERHREPSIQWKYEWQ